jgi:hypothetical protein
MQQTWPKAVHKILRKNQIVGSRRFDFLSILLSLDAKKSGEIKATYTLLYD